ncbi:glycosyltransferase [Actinomycetospora sp. CA-053990]|uniref:glycosyltransferase n=1 Tax=Actinomycetospora sp. CA-053990 TaxID=3239891 RepID=UPI003D9386E8
MAVVQMAMGAYRQGFITYLEEQGTSIEFFVGDQHFGQVLRTEVNSGLVRRTGQNLFLARRRIGYQPVKLRLVLKYPQVVVELNPRNITTWAILISRLVLGRPSHGWGHVDPRGHRGVATLQLRRTMQKMCSSLITYTEAERERAKELFPKKPIRVAANALYRAKDMTEVTQGGLDVVWIGRVVEEKKPLLAIDSWREFVRARGTSSRLLVVGDGPLLEAMKERARTAGVRESVEFFGRVNDSDVLRKIFGRCRLMLATGYVGLNVTQGLGFGLPVVYPEQEPHAPEIEALDPDNSLTFASENAESCAHAVQAAFASDWHASEIAAAARKRYSVEAMATPFLDLARGGAK